MKKNLSITFASTLQDITSLNHSFDQGILRIAYTGLNRNNSFISKESFEKAIPSMFNCPVVAHYFVEENEIGSHDSELIEDDDGNIRLVYKTDPVGVVPESAKWFWDTVEEDDGTLHEYLCTNVLLWKRQACYQKIKENGITKHSMEIDVYNGEFVDGMYKIHDFEFTAFCLLGADVEPCFESSALIMFLKDEFKMQFTEMMQELKYAFGNEDVQEKTDKEEKQKTMRLSELLEKYQVAESDLTFSIEGLSDEELTAKFEEVYGQTAAVDDDADGADGATTYEEGTNDDAGEPEVKPTANDYALNSQVRDELRKAVYALGTYTDEYGTWRKYYMVDFDVETSEVFMEDTQDWNLYGCSYSMNGDVPVIDIDTLHRKKFIIVDFEDGEPEGMAYAASEIHNAFTAVLDAQKKTITNLENQVKELTEFKNTALRAQEEERINALFEQFDEKLSGVDEYEALKEKHDDYTAASLETELYALIGKMSFIASNTAFTKVGGLETENAVVEPYGGLMAGKEKR